MAEVREPDCGKLKEGMVNGRGEVLLGVWVNCAGLLRVTPSRIPILTPDLRGSLSNTPQTPPGTSSGLVSPLFFPLSHCGLLAIETLLCFQASLGLAGSLNTVQTLTLWECWRINSEDHS